MKGIKKGNFISLADTNRLSFFPLFICVRLCLCVYLRATCAQLNPFFFNFEASQLHHLAVTFPSSPLNQKQHRNASKPPYASKYKKKKKKPALAYLLIYFFLFSPFLAATCRASTRQETQQHEIGKHHREKGNLPTSPLSCIHHLLILSRGVR